MKDLQAIIMHSVSRWDQPLSSASLSLAKEISKTHLVFYVDHPFTVKDLIFNLFSKRVQRRLKSLVLGINIYYKIEADNNKLIGVAPKVTLPINWLPAGKLYNTLWTFNNTIFLTAINKIIRDHQIKKYIYFNSYNPFYGHPLKVKIKPMLYIYQTRDNIAMSNYVKKHGPLLESKVAKYADLCLATSYELTRKMNEIAPTILFPNAANFSLFKKSLEIKNSQKKDKKIIGYFGNIGIRFDFELLQKIILKFKDAEILLVGPYNYSKYTSINFHEYDNVTFTGPKKLEELPYFLSKIDCAVLPFEKNELTRSIYPLKINEYLAGGKAVVTTNFSEDLDQFKNLIYIAEDHDKFLKFITCSFNENKESLIYSRIKEAEENSWSKRTILLWNLVERAYEKKRT